MSFLKKIKLHHICSKKAVTRGIGLGILVLMGSLLFTITFFASTVFKKYQAFLNTANLSHSQVIELILKTKEAAPAASTTFLILGVDEVENRPEHPQLTDTMMLMSADPKTGKVVTLPLPRDLWNEPYKTKINALYEYGKERDPENPTHFPKQIISEMTELEIDHVLVISLEQLGLIIDMLGCININVEHGFVDHQFPRSDVDITVERDPSKLYETIEFKEGVQAMDSELALKYIRSRNSLDAEAGSDLARAQRQQQIIQAVVEKLSNPKIFWYYPQLAGELLSFYQREFEQYLPLNQALALGYTLATSSEDLELRSAGLTVYPDDPIGVIEHPRNLAPYQQQWVYIIRDQANFKELVQKTLSLDHD